MRCSFSISFPKRDGEGSLIRVASNPKKEGKEGRVLLPILTITIVTCGLLGTPHSGQAK